MFGEAVVELHRGVVRFVGVPVDAGSVRQAGLFADAFDQSAADPPAARRRSREQVL